MIPDAAFDISGFLGVALYLGAYGALQVGLLRGSGYAYTLLNLAAACFILVSLSHDFNIWSAAIQISWIALSIVGLTRLAILTSRLRFTAEERAFLDTKFPDLEPILARRLVSAGTWSDAPAGTVLAREGEPVPALVFLHSGRAAITVAGRAVATCEAGALVGEFGAASGQPAIATATLAERSRILSIPAAALVALMARHPGIRTALDAGIGAEARAKMMAANSRAAAE
jgi:CRP-like cAMP-binding protein